MSVGQASGLSLRGQLLTHVGTGCDGRNAGYPDGTRPFHFHFAIKDGYSATVYPQVGLGFGLMPSSNHIVYKTTVQGEPCTG